MGIGSSSMQQEYRQKRRYPPSKHGKKQRRGLLRRPRPRTPSQTVPHGVPIKYHSYNKYAYGYGYGSYPYVQPAPIYPSLPQPQAYSGYMPMYNNNYRQPVMAPQVQVPLYQPGMMPQQVPISQPMPMSRQVPPSMYPPYSYPPSAAAVYPTSVPYSVPNVQPQAQPPYNNVVSSPSFSPVANPSTPNIPASSFYPITSGQLSTDWTGGGKISPGFLGPPI